jgi:SAM-dependent methyltransferase
VNRLQKNWIVLDIGCGNGALAYDLKEKCASVFAIDINPENIERARAEFSRDGVIYICGDAVMYDFQQKCDAIILSNFLEHIKDRIGFLRRLYENQNSEDPPVLLVRVPMITRDWISLYKKEIGVEWRLDSTHHTEYTLEEVKGELREAGLEIESYEIQFGEFYGVAKKI